MTPLLKPKLQLTLLLMPKLPLLMLPLLLTLQQMLPLMLLLKLKPLLKPLLKSTQATSTKIQLPSLNFKKARDWQISLPGFFMTDFQIRC